MKNLEKTLKEFAGDLINHCVSIQKNKIVLPKTGLSSLIDEYVQADTISNMAREEMIEVLIEEKFWEWIYARCTDSLEIMLRMGWKGLDDYTDEELREALEGVDIKECRKMIKEKTRKGGDEN